MNPLYPTARAYFRPAAILAAVLLCPQHLLAWSGNGHCIVGQIAQDLLQQDNDPKSKAALGQIQQILGVSSLSPNALSELAPCADQIRSVDEETGAEKAAGGKVECGGLTLAMNPASEPWHFINFPVNYSGSWQSKCPGNNCVVGQIILDVQGLQSNEPLSKRQTDLMYLVHFVGDVHQPLHCAFTTLNGVEDRGGNCEQVKPSSGSKLNWHALWDHQLNDAIPNDCQQEAKSLEGQTSIDGGSDAAAIASQAAQESLDAANTLYQDLEGVGNQSGMWDKQSCQKKPVPPAIPLPSNYESANEHIVTERLATAGGRLAALLKIALGGGGGGSAAPEAPATGGKPPRRHRTTDSAPAAALDSTPNAAGVENVLQQQ
jgi:hypothetical protein